MVAVTLADIGCQTPYKLVAPSPEGYTVDDAEDALAYAAFYQLEADPWQATTCEAWMRRTREGRWCSSKWSISVPRQNGKNGILEIFELYAMAELGLAILHTAHEVKTARKAFARLKGFFGEKANDPGAKYPELNELVKEIRHVNGQEAIILKNGGSIEFIARSKGSGRGFTVDVLVLDEAQELQEIELQALLPVISAAPSGDPVTIYMGTPPADIGEHGEPFVNTRTKALDGSDVRSAWVEYAAPGDIEDMKPHELTAYLDDVDNWYYANPALGIRMNLDTIRSERNTFNDQSFARERLNKWPSDAGKVSPIKQEVWDRFVMTRVPEEWPLAAIGIDMNPERTRVTITMAVFTPWGVHLEIAEDAPFAESGSEALVEWVYKRARRNIPVVIDAFSPVRSMEPMFRNRKIKLRVLTAAELSQACGGLYDAVTKDRTVTHFGQEQLDQSLAGGVKQKFGDGGAWKWNRRSLDIDLTPIMSATCAHFGAVKFGKRRRNGHKPTGKVVIL